jgi:hypothetical protein
MKKFTFACFVLAFSFIACKSDSTRTPAVGQTTEKAAAVIDPASIKLICQPSEEPNTQADAPRHEVFIQMGDSKVKLADMLNCEAIEANAFEQYQIPANALSAVGGWWAGAGDYLYVVLEGDHYVVKKGDMDEGRMNNDYGYKSIMTFSKDGKEVF